MNVLEGKVSVVERKRIAPNPHISACRLDRVVFLKVKFTLTKHVFPSCSLAYLISSNQYRSDA